ncbi:condensation domain-containing protein, partial [Streptomyces sp. 6N223]|uniref:condensation domain-containing protein n=1 Tax=Streptomyces sp. 6N223 TaxID=3457412 RepID=UPI003FD029F9
MQYADYTLWQRELLGEEHDPESRFSRQYAYWAEQLAGLPEQVTLPADRPRPAVISYRGDSAGFVLEAELHRGMVELARSAGVTVHMVLHAALAALLTRLGAGTDIPVGTGVAGRTDERLADLVGLFVNTLVLRTDTSGNPTFAELLGQARETSLAAFTHQDIPFEALVERLNPQRSTAYHPLFQIALVLQNNEPMGFDLPDLSVRTQEAPTRTSRYDVFVSVSERFEEDTQPARLEVWVEYATDLYDRGTIEAFIARWERLLQAMVVDPQQRIATPDLLAPTERERLLTTYGHNRRDIAPVTLPELFEAQVAAAPEALAVEAEDVAWSYAELNERANRIAHWLMGRGIGPERVVGVAMPRCAEQVAVVLGIVKAGAAYLPIDPAYPAERIRYIA